MPGRAHTPFESLEVALHVPDPRLVDSNIAELYPRLADGKAICGLHDADLGAVPRRGPPDAFTAERMS